MQPLIHYALYLFIGVVAYAMLFKVQSRLSILYKIFFIAAPIITIGSLSVGYLHVIFGNSETILVKDLLFVTNTAGNGLYILLGYCITGIVFNRITRPLISTIDEQCILIVKGLSIAIGLTFISASVGKIFGFTFMLEFFNQSGYTKSFLYFIMALEFTFGMILLFNIRFYLKLAALTILLSDMIGAVVTHLRNHDPLDDSGSAILLAVKILILLSLYVLVDSDRNRQIKAGNAYHTKRNIV